MTIRKNTQTFDGVSKQYCDLRNEWMEVANHTQRITKDEIRDKLMRNEHPLEELITLDHSDYRNQSSRRAISYSKWKAGYELPKSRVATGNSYRKKKHKEQANRLRMEGLFGLAYDYDCVTIRTEHWSKGYWGMLIKMDYSNIVGYEYFMVTEAPTVRPHRAIKGIRFDSVDELVDTCYDILNGKPVATRHAYSIHHHRSCWTPSAEEYCEPIEFVKGLEDRKEGDGELIEQKAA